MSAHSRFLLPALVCLVALPTVAVQPFTSVVGGGEAFDNSQESLGLRYLVRLASDDFDDLGEVGLFAAREQYLPSGWVEAAGQTLDISSNQSLFSKLGTRFGGDGEQTFKLPDLRGRTAIGAGSGPGLPTYAVGDAVGQEQVTLTIDQIPSHTHALGGGYAAGAAGGGMSHSNLQPSLALTPIIAVSGNYPSRNLIDPGVGGQAEAAAIGIGGGDPYLSELSWIAHHQVPDGWMIADGSILPINNNAALFSLLGTEFGGDGRTNFALPDLRGRAAVGANGFQQVGLKGGEHDEALTLSQLPAHDHELPSGGTTGPTGTGQPQSNRQPTLGLTTVVALTGVYPSAPATSEVGEEGDTPPIGEIGTGSEPSLGSITRFGASFAPRGFAYASGQDLDISSNTALFSLFAELDGGGFTTLYGDNGSSRFDLPNLEDRLAVGAGAGVGLVNRQQGEQFGAEESALTVANLPEHSHLISVPGDYNNNGVVDAADYTVWRDNVGQPAGTLPNDEDGGDIGPAQYDTWAANYGLPGFTPPPSTAVPEPSAVGLAMLGLIGLSRTTRRPDRTPAPAR
ncbi:Phage Tail Collar Domain protein [Planctomycetes bacterium MalM25]|nr:Phage Tail Collar Domain protein [Planctomycetes bacterium MalM25]